ncbi:hypothetical protein ACIRJL_17195 [Streptomyces sp. NPDC102383]|uniref:hypothetical protein n=1 Tax=Streptomyces sp. NPDC102383 TaxID=3366165 RepID=UPI00382F17AF
MSERPTLEQAVTAALNAKQQAHADATRPQREQVEQQATADAKLMNTPAWDALSGFRRARATAYATRPAAGDGTAAQHDGARAQGGADDAA